MQGADHSLKLHVGRKPYHWKQAMLQNNLVQNYELDIKVAVMDCVVNGPGEAKEAGIGIAGGIGEGLLIKKGEIIKKVPEAELLDTLKEELDNWKG